MPTLFFSFTTSAEAEQFAQMLPQADVQSFLASLSKARQSVFVADCWRSLGIIVIGAFVLLLYHAKKLQTLPMLLIIGALCLCDLWLVNKRYLNDSMFKPKREQQHIRPLTDADRLILQDQSLDYRVLNLTGNTFNENETSYYHKSVGGYHAAKLRRYQDLIETYISKEMQQVLAAINQYQGDLTQAPADSLCPVLNMLNTKYFLAAQQNMAIPNPHAQGNAWFVDCMEYVDGAQAEMDGLYQVDLRHEAVADRQFQQLLGEATPTDTTATVMLTSYEPNQLRYDVNSQQGGIVVFSEIYYPGWTATIDGQPATLGRADYVLRALRIDGGKHEVVLSFFPKSISTTETIAYIALVVLLLLIVGGIVLTLRRKK